MKGASGMRDTLILLADDSFESDPKGRISSRNPKIRVRCSRAQLVTSGTASAAVGLLKDASGGVLSRGRLSWYRSTEEKCEEKISAAVQHQQNQAKSQENRPRLGGVEAMFNEPTAAVEDIGGSSAVNMPAAREQAIDDIALYGHELRCETQWRVKGSGIAWVGGMQFQCAVSEPAKDKAEFVKRGHDPANWKPKREWCDETGQIKDCYKSGGDAIVKFWKWEKEFFTSSDTCAIVKSTRNRVFRLVYGDAIGLQIYDFYLERTENGDPFKLQPGDNILLYKYVSIAVKATILYLTGLNELLKVMNSHIIGDPISDRSSITFANYMTDSQLQKYILMNVSRRFDTPSLRIKLQNKKFKDGKIGKKIVQQVLF